MNIIRISNEHKLASTYLDVEILYWFQQGVKPSWMVSVFTTGEFESIIEVLEREIIQST